MWKVRKTKTGSRNTAVQVVRREHQRTIIIKHIGTARNEDELRLLRKQAERYILTESGINPLFPELFGQEKQLTLSDVQDVFNRLDGDRAYHSFAHIFLSWFYDRLGFTSLKNNLLRDLAFIRIVEPCSKRRSLELLDKYFALHYGRTNMHQQLPGILKQKEAIERITIAFARKQYAFDCNIVFYDVTTLYYESFTEDEDIIDKEGNVIEKGLRKNGFGKENKPGQPQIIIGLIVTKEGFPVSYEVFEGNTFEGDTFIPVILSFKQKYEIEEITIVADAAMISYDNVKKLKAHKLSYIVGGRLANLKRDQIQVISTALIDQTKDEKELQKRDGISTRIETERGILVCDFSFKRYQKDKADLEKQIIRAKKLVEKNAGGKRAKFLTLKKKKENIYEVSAVLIEQTTLLLGIKGYYTNLFDKNEKLTNQNVIDHYHNLWHVEKAFRIAKSDLKARPIFHHKRESIEAHIVIVFVSLCISKSIEMLTKLSIKKVRDTIWDVLDIQFTDIPTGKTFTKQINATGNPMVALLKKLQNVDNGTDNIKSRTI